VALSIGLIGSASAASTLNLKAEAQGKYTAEGFGDLSSVVTNYDVKATSGGNRFWTFCLEAQVYFQSDKIYNASTSLATDSPSGPDTISNSTAYLYEQFASGQLTSLFADFTYNSSGGTRLQNMIWWLEGETGGVQDAAMWSLLGITFGSTALDNYSGTSVGVLNLTKYVGTGGDSLSGTLRQDQLVYRGPSTQPAPPSNNVPDGGTSASLLAVALLGLGAIRRGVAK